MTVDLHELATGLGFSWTEKEASPSVPILPSFLWFTMHQSFRQREQISRVRTLVLYPKRVKLKSGIMGYPTAVVDGVL